MEVQPQEPDEKSPSTFTVLVTGANSGLGFAICCRLIDEFLFTRPQSQKLHLLYSTRDAKKSEDTLKRLNAHLQKTLQSANGRAAPGLSLLLEGRVKIEGVLVDLTKLLTVKALAKQLLLRGERLDAVVWNAGIAGWSYLNYFKAVPQVLFGIIQATTYPRYMVCDVGALAKPQLGGYGQVHTFAEPRLGQVFTANVFGHYMLTHWLSPLMDGQSRIVWITSISGTPDTFNVEDLQCLHASEAYESSKRLTDLLVVTSDLPSTQTYVKSFLPTKATNGSANGTVAPNQRPQMYATHPGVVATSIAGLNWFISIFMLLAMYIARWIGSPWHAVTAYKGAISAVYAVLSPASQLPELESREGKGKWGSAVDVYGEERVVRTEIEGWGFGREFGVKPSGSIGAKRPGYQATTKEMREEFEMQGQRVWREMEEMRVEWERRLGKLEVDEKEAADM